MEDGWSAEKNGSRQRGAAGWIRYSRIWSGDWENKGRDQSGSVTYSILRSGDIIHEWARHGDELQRGCAQHLRFLAWYSWWPSTVSQKCARRKPQQQVEPISQRLEIAFSQTTRLGLFGRVLFAKRCWSFNDVQAESVASWMGWRMLHQTTHIQDYCKPAAGWIPHPAPCRLQVNLCCCTKVQKTRCTNAVWHRNRCSFHAMWREPPVLPHFWCWRTWPCM